MTAWLLLAVGIAHAQQRLPNQQNSMEGPATGFGVGGVVGTPSGLALSWRPDTKQAVQVATGFSSQKARFAMNVDYVRTVWAFFSKDQSWIMPLYVGGGARIRTADEELDPPAPTQTGMGVRLPVGLRVYPEDIRLDLFAEVGPALHIASEISYTFDFAVGVRLWAGGKEER